MTTYSKSQSSQFNGPARRVKARQAARSVGLSVFQVRNHANYHTVVFDRIITSEQLEDFTKAYRAA